MDDSEIFMKIDRIFRNVDQVKKEPDFSNMILKCQTNISRKLYTNEEMLREMAKIIAFSQGAKSKKVEKMLNDGVFEKLFFGFDINQVARIDCRAWFSKHWIKGAPITCIRFKKKIPSIITCAQILMDMSKPRSFFKFIEKVLGSREQLRTTSDVDRFWKGFDNLRAEFKKVKMPYISSITSLLHLLMTIGYDCAKPDLIVMKVSKEIGIVSSSKSDKDLIKVIRVIQRYAVDRNIKPSVVDFYLLLYGNHSTAEKYIIKQVDRI